MQLWKGRVPIYSDLHSAWSTATSFGSLAPGFVIASLATVLYISIPLSGTLLYQRNTFGAVLAYIQFPFRLAFVLPSLFFITWIVAPLQPLSLSVSLIVVTELLKLWSLRSWQTRAA